MSRIQRLLTNQRNRRFVFLSATSFLTSIAGFAALQFAGGFITTFSIWTLTQSQITPPEFPFIYLPEFFIYLFIFAISVTAWVFFARKWRLLS